MKIKKIEEYLNLNNLDVAFINNPATIAYLCGYHSDPHERILALVITAKNGSFLFTPALEVIEAQQVVEMPVYGYHDHENPWEIIQQSVADLTTGNNWTVEKNYLTMIIVESLQQIIPTIILEDDLTLFIQKMMLIKSEDEIAKMILAGEWADFALKVGRETLRIGVSEAEVVAEIEYQLKRKGINQMSFSTLVLFGDHAASPHGMPGNRKLQANELVLFDLGVVCQGYTSDVTRTVAFGNDLTSQQIEVYQVVKKANEAAMAAVKPGITAATLDKIARDIICDAGYGAYFIHRLGHGLGSSVHEYPSIMEGNDLVIQEGMCFSIEPGIYIPDEVGVRIEDCLYVTKTGHVPFTVTTKDLLFV